MKNPLYILLGLIFIAVALLFFFAVFVLQAGASIAGFFSTTGPFGTIIIISALAIGGFYFLKIGVTSMKELFK